VLAAALPLGGAAQPPPGDVAPESAPAAVGAPSFPLAPGTFWVYRETYTEHLGELDSSQEADTRFVVRGPATRPFILQTGGFDPAPGPLERGDGWLRLAPWTGEEALPWPPDVGREAPGPDGAPGWRVEAEEEVRVPAGTFTARRCALRTRRSESVLWIVPGVGVVRETQGQPGRRPEIERVLVKWSAPAQP
jgi:hypothetical protein